MPSSVETIVTLACRTVPSLLLDGLMLLAFVLCLVPAWFRFVWFYAFASDRCSLRYDRSSCRQTTDVYCLDRSAMERGLQRYRRDKARSASTAVRTGVRSAGNGTDASPAATGIPTSGDTNELSTLLLAPVVVFFTGGAWLIGYKMWGALLARVLAASGIVVVIPDYRNYPWSTVPGMVDDIDGAIRWTHENIHMFGGDNSKVLLVGQSAGGHLACTALLRRAVASLEASSCENNHDRSRETQSQSSNPSRKDEAPDANGSAVHPLEQAQNDRSDRTDSHSRSSSVVNATPADSWLPKDRVVGLLTLSAPNDLSDMERTFRRHGMDEQFVDRIFDGRRRDYDPVSLVRSVPHRKGDALADLLPPMQILHGTADKTVPHDSSRRFATALQGLVGSDKVGFALYEGWSHTDPILEGPMAADHRFHADIIAAVRRLTDASSVRWPLDENSTVLERLCPDFLIRMARWCNPF